MPLGQCLEEVQQVGLWSVQLRKARRCEVASRACRRIRGQGGTAVYCVHGTRNADSSISTHVKYCVGSTYVGLEHTARGNAAS